jgi:phage shock protein PspC (stress-responsive transcriptional regulator)
MLIVSSSHALGQTLALLATFIGIGVLVTVLIIYVVAQVIAEHKQNQESEPGAG